MKYSHSSRDMSLVEQKKLQWAKEKEELAKLNEIFSTTIPSRQCERTSIRTYYSNGDLTTSASTPNSNTIPRQQNRYNEPLNLHKNPNNYNGNTMMASNNRHESGRSRVYAPDFYGDNDNHYHANDSISFGNDSSKHYYKENVRSPILPPIEQNTNHRTNQMRNHSMNPNTDEDTSGYLSDLSNFVYPSSADELTNSLNGMRMVDNKIEARHRQQGHVDVEYNEPETVFSMPKTPTSMCSDNQHYLTLSAHPPYRKEKEERAKWGDRNNHLYDSVSKESSIKSDGPCWLERSLADSGDESVKSYSFIRGQNAPIDPNVLAERTTKRLKAMEFQNAIKAQVEERERLRKMEQERLLAEENRHQNSMRQQLESNEKRMEDEQRKLRERIEKEQRKQEMMRIAIEKARQAAESEKAKRKRIIHHDIEDYCVQQQINSIIKQQQDAEELQRQTNTDRWNQNNNNNSNCAAMENSASIEPKETDSSDNTNSIDDGEQILIGTPIRMKKKTLNKPIKSSQSISNEKDIEKSSAKIATTTSLENNIDGIALVLQTLPPILSNDIINLNQNINNLNTSNIQLAVMLAHLQQLNSMAHNQMPDLLNAKINQMQKETRDHLTDHKVSLMPTQTLNSKIGDSDNVLASYPNKNLSTPDNLCKQCTQSLAKLSSNIQEENDGVNDTQTQMTTKTDTGTVTNDIELSNNSINNAHNDNVKVVKIPDTDIITDQPLTHQSTMLDASTQTDKKLEVEYCFQCEFHQCHHHHVIVKDLAFNCSDDIKTVAINHLNPTNECNEKDCALINRMDQMDMDNNSDNNKEEIKKVSQPSSSPTPLPPPQPPQPPLKIENRPKWGVNRPLQQYVKASERDPFYLRNKRKKHRKRHIDHIIDVYKSCDDDDDDDDDTGEIKENSMQSSSRSISPSPSIITNSTVTLNSTKRSVCTEILPIKTDLNGRVYLNFREASLLMSEDETLQTVKPHNRNRTNRIMNRCRTVNDMHNESIDVQQKNEIG